jgi:hypothetical protein
MQGAKTIPIFRLEMKRITKVRNHSADFWDHLINYIKMGNFLNFVGS